MTLKAKGRKGLWSLLRVNIADTFIISAFTTARLLGGSRHLLNYVFFFFTYFFSFFPETERGRGKKTICLSCLI